MMNVSNWSPWRIKSSGLAVVVDVFVQDLDPDDVADDVGGPVVVAAHPRQAEVGAVGVLPDNLQAGEVPLGQPVEVEVVEDVAVDDQFARIPDRPEEERFKQPRLAHVAAEVQVADHQAVVGRTARLTAGRAASSIGRGGHDPELSGRASSGSATRDRFTIR